MYRHKSHLISLSLSTVASSHIHRVRTRLYNRLGHLQWKWSIIYVSLLWSLNVQIISEIAERHPFIDIWRSGMHMRNGDWAPHHQIVMETIWSTHSHNLNGMYGFTIDFIHQTKFLCSRCDFGVFFLLFLHNIVGVCKRQEGLFDYSYVEYSNSTLDNR